MKFLAQLDPMTTAEQWNWVILAYGFTVVALATFTTSIAIRIRRARRRLSDEP
jgi:hypothetical protein